VAPQSLLHAVVTIVVKKRLVNSIPFYFVGSGSAAVAARVGDAEDSQLTEDRQKVVLLN
jgi:hypothetical protein